MAVRLHEAALSHHTVTLIYIHMHTHLLKPFLLQTDHIKVKVCPQTIGPVESDSPSQAIPVGLEREWRRENTEHTHFTLFDTLLPFLLLYQSAYTHSVAAFVPVGKQLPNLYRYLGL